MVQIIDNPLQLNPAQSAAMGAQLVAPINDAIVRNGENQLAMARYLGEQQFRRQEAQTLHQHQLEAAKAQHDMMIERANIQTQSRIKIAKMAADAHMAQLEKTGALNDIKTANAYLVNQLGGKPVQQLDGESDKDYLNRVKSATANKLTDNIQQDSMALASRKAAYERIQNDPAIQSALQKAKSDPNIQSAARGAATANLNDWIQRVAPDRAGAVMDAIQKRPDQANLILQGAGLGNAFNDFYNQNLMAEVDKSLRATGHVGEADAISRAKGIEKEITNLSMMPSSSGKMVPKTWWGQTINAADSYKTLAQDPNAANHMQFNHETSKWELDPSYRPPSANNPIATTGAEQFGPLRPVVKAAAPVVAAPTGYDAAGNFLNTAAFSPTNINRALQASHDTIGWTDQERDQASQIPGFMAGAMHGINPVAAYGALFDSSVGNQVGTDPSIQFRALPLPAGTVPRQAVVQQPQPIFTPPPQMAFPPGANLSGQFYPETPVVVPQDSQNPYDKVGAAMDYQAQFQQPTQ